MVQHNTIDHTGITGVGGSFGSNANTVASASAAGASTLHSAADHVHVGTTSIAHTSNTFSGPVILTAAGTLGITSPAAGTFELSASGGAGGGFTEVGTATRTAGDLTTTSTSFVDATSLSVTITTAAVRCLVIFSGNAKNDGANNTAFTLDIDAANQGGTYGLSIVDNTGGVPCGFTFLTGVLSAASHTFKVQWRVDAGTGTLFASSSVTPATLHVIETSMTS